MTTIYWVTVKNEKLQGFRSWEDASDYADMLKEEGYKAIGFCDEQTGEKPERINPYYLQAQQAR